MTTLIIGGSGSGKSAYAEAYLLALSEGKRKYYLAAMQACDEESRARVERHRKMREGKAFVTIEQPVRVQEALALMEAGEKTALLECVSNLTANEMFGKEGRRPEAAVVEEVTEGIAMLREKLAHLVIVSNNVFEDGRVYDQGTTAYLRAMGQINRRLSAMADEVVEVAAGIPIVIKACRREGVIL